MLIAEIFAKTVCALQRDCSLLVTRYLNASDIASMSLPNGTGLQNPVNGERKRLPNVVGINFGNTYASIAVLTKVG